MAIYPNTRGFAFAAFEGALTPADWGIADVRGKRKNRECLRRIAVLFGRYEPDVLVLQDTSESGTHRARRIRELNEAIEVLAETQSIPVVAYSRKQVLECFRQFGCFNRYMIAETLAKRIPVFERYLPPQRKIWMSEDSRMALFDAAALVFTNQGHYHTLYSSSGSPSES